MRKGRDEQSEGKYWGNVTCAQETRGFQRVDLTLPG